MTEGVRLTDDELRAVVMKRQAAKDIRDKAEATRAQCDDQLKTELALRDGGRVETPEHLVTLVYRETAGQLDPKLLLEHGVSMDIIEKSRKPGSTSVSVLVTERRG